MSEGVLVYSCISMTTNDTIITYHNHSMATTGTGQGPNQRRRLPKLIPPNSGDGSGGDETHRTIASEDTARQRRRARQQSARQPTPDGRETVSPPPANNVTRFFY